MPAEALCEADFVSSWQGPMPSLGFAGVEAARAIDQALLAQLNHAWMQHPRFPAGRWPAMTVAITHGSKLVFVKSYGFADMETPALAHPDDLFRLASDSKQITGATILKLIANGQSVDGDPSHKLTLASKVFPILASEPNAIVPLGGRGAMNPALEDITVGDVLHHTGGWAYNIGDPVWYAKEASRSMFPVTERAVVAKMMTLAPTLSPPGQTFSYSNFGYNLLATLITKVTGRDYETVAKEQVLRPLGITRTRVGQSLAAGRADGEVRYYAFLNSPSARSLFPESTGPTIAGDENVPYGSWSVEAGRGAGGWIASSIDLVRFQIGVNGRNPAAQVYPNVAADILSPVNQPYEALCTSTCKSAPTTPVNPAKDRYNAGWGVHFWGPPYNGFELDHGGGVNGAGSFTESIPDAPGVEGYGFALLINTSAPPYAQIDVNAAVRNAMLRVLKANGGSLLDAGWPADTDFFDQFGDFGPWTDLKTLEGAIAASANGCTVAGKAHRACYASRIEGKTVGGEARYRAQIVPLHAGDEPAHVAGATCSAYVEANARMAASGHRPIDLAWYRDASGALRFQSVWVKVGAALSVPDPARP